MKKIIKYQLLSFSLSEHLNDAVKSYLGLGYQPYGEPIIIYTAGECYHVEYSQAMVKYED